MSHPEVLNAALQIAEVEASKKNIVTLGIAPSYAATGYGYIELGEAVSSKGELAAHPVKAFIEKPEKKAADKMVQEKRFFWNAGLFVFRVDHMIELMKMHLPGVWSKVSEIKPDFSNAAYVYANIQPISLDYGIMEKTKDLVCIPCDPGWSDVGSWDEVARLSEEVPTDSQAQIFISKGDNNFVYSTRPKVIGLSSVSDLIVVDTPDALLVTRKGESQDVKALVENMRVEKVIETTEHAFSLSKWGRTESLDESADYKISKLTFDRESQAELSPATYLVVDGELEWNKTSYGANSVLVLNQPGLISNRSTRAAVLLEVSNRKGRA